jgi:hypothetical protein
MNARNVVLIFIAGVVAGGAVLYFLSKHALTVTPQTYTNLEEWEIVKDPTTGRVQGVRVKRTAGTR